MGGRPGRTGLLRSLTLAWAVVLAGCGPASSTGPDADGGDADLTVRLQPIAQGLDRPLLATAPPGDPRIFIVEQVGRIRVVAEGNLVDEPYLDITHLVGAGGERGLLGLAFDPDFRANGRFYVGYTDKAGDSRVAVYHDVDRGNRANPGSGRILLELEQPFGNHNGGHLTFGPDGMLYVGFGDGGGAGDPLNAGQDLSTLLGKILRVDISGALEDGWEVPDHNPFVGTAGARPEIWHLGLRNPWRFSFDRDGGMLYIADVGQNEWEEVNAVPADRGGLNFGWKIMEGPECFETAECEAEDLILPVAVYTHRDGCSVTGGHVYRGQMIPGLRGRYVYGDYCRGWIRAFTLAENGTATDPVELELESPGRITSFGTTAAGELLVVVEGGTVFQLVPG